VNRNALLYLKKRPDADRGLLIKGIADGLHYLHSQDVIHGDIKPNVLVNSEGHAMLCDFGLAMILQEVSTHPRTGSRYSTPRFSAPELIEDTGDNPPPRTKFTDMWAFGCTGMQISSGIQPYDGFTTLNQLVFAMVQKTAPYPNFKKEPLESVLAQCLTWCPQDRIKMSDVVKHLEAGTSPQHLVLAVTIQTFAGHGQSLGS